MIVSVMISAYNEENYLPQLCEALLKQTYPKKDIEIIFVNGMSTDRTKVIMEEFQKNYQDEFYDIQVWDNERKTLATGLNLAFKKGTGEVFVKIDAHSLVTDTFIEESVKVIESGESVCGGKRPTISEDQTPFAQMLHSVEESMFGSSIANYRKSDDECYVKSVFQGMYRREVVEHCGLFDEQLVRTEDNEFHCRIREHGYKIKYSPDIVSYQYMRPTFSKMLKQKYNNGYWIGLTAHVKPKALSLYHYIPCLFVLALMISIALLPIATWPLDVLMDAYLLLAIFITGVTIVRNRKSGFNPYDLFIPGMLFLVHASYGIGTIIGFFKGFSWKKTYRKENWK